MYIQYLYGVPTTPATNTSNRLAVTGYDIQYANIADPEVRGVLTNTLLLCSPGVQLFLKQYRPDMNLSTTFTVETLDGGANFQNGSQAGFEAVGRVLCNVSVSSLFCATES